MKHKSSLPYRQLRNNDAGKTCLGAGSLPYRQLRKLWAQSPGAKERSLPYRQLRNAMTALSI